MTAKRKIYSLISAVLFICVAGGLCACQKTEKTSSESEKNLPEIKIGVDILKPFFYVDENGEYTGIDAEIAKEACKRAGYKPEFTDVEWSDRDEYLENGDVDCLWSAFSEDGREDKYLWTESYMEDELRVIVDSKCPSKSLEDYRGPGGIAVRSGSKVEEILLEDSKSEDSKINHIYSCGTFEMAQTAFIKEYADALACNKIVLQQIIDENPEMYRYLDGSIMTVHLGVAFKKEENNAYWNKINDAIEEMKQDGTILKIAEKYGCNVSVSDGGSSNGSK